ncbi:MAG: amidohydrolase family protein [Pseudomonadota bacterium]
MLIRDGLIVDGSGTAPYRGDVQVRNGRIAAISAPGVLTAAPGSPIIEAAGRVVAPGFIDPHSHGNPFETRDFSNFLSMGVTTITLGQDGSSPRAVDLERWQRSVESTGIAPNVALFIGHGTLRRELGIGNSERLSEDQQARLEAALDQALDHTFGLSTGLEYTPGLYAQLPELEGLARVVGRRGRIIMSHLRSEDDDQLQTSLAELVAQGRHCRVHVAHLKSVYGKGAARGREVLSWIQAARREGIAISADVYPYSASYTGLALLFPTWAKTPETFAQAKLERREALEQYLRNRVLKRNGPEATVLGTEPYRGIDLATLAARLNKPFEQVLIDELGPAGFSAAYFVMNDELQEALLADPQIAISSDGSPTGFHPRGHGTHAKVIESYVVNQGTLTLAEAIHKMTGLPAQLLGVTDRGLLRPGLAADLIVFDPQQVRARATYTAPLTLATGFDLVFVNGVLVRSGDQQRDALPGQLLRPAASTTLAAGNRADGARSAASIQGG